MTDAAPVLPPHVDTAQFRQAMSMLAGAVTVIATGSPSEGPQSWRGMTATAVCSVSDEPPSLLVCLNRTAGTYRQLVTNGLFSVNVLSSQLVSIAQTFAGRDGLSGADRFTDQRWVTGRLGVPVIPDALASLECRSSRYIEYATHALVIGRVEAAYWAPDNDAAAPLVYHARRFLNITSEQARKGETP
jgi:flavin reductase (DIM6/NTAB) family NADH-FMN oxidoreductase RutF